MNAEVDRVIEFWRTLDLPGVIDVHTHFMPDRVMQKVWDYFDAVGPLTGRAWPIRYRMSEEERVNQLRAFGVRAFTAMIYPHKRDMAAWLNEWAADFAARTPDCLHTATFYPEPFAESYVEQAITSGARIFKSHIQVGDYHPNDPLLRPVWELLEESGIPVVIHCGSGPAPGVYTGPQPIREVLARYPRLQLIIAHMGMPEYLDFLDIAEEYPEVRLDTTMVFTEFLEDTPPFPVAEHGRLRDLGDRILFGSDFPNIPYSYADALTGLTRLGLGNNWIRGVCYENASRLFGIPAKPDI